MRRLHGVPAATGAAVGPAFVHRADVLDLDGPVQGTPDMAFDAVASDLSKAAGSATGEAAEILQAQAAMARDPALRAAVAGSGAPPARAAAEAGEEFAARLESTGNEYLAVRAADVRHICQAAARLLLGKPRTGPPAPAKPSVLVADDLSPADTVALNPRIVLALATSAGSPTSHTAIVARGLGIPAVVGVRGLADVVEGDVVGVDGASGDVFVHPDAATVERRAAEHQRARVRSGAGPVETKDGRRVEVAANIRSVEELRLALAEGAEAVGLLRTELLYVDRDRPPSEAEQVALLRELRAALGDRRLIVRTFDIGSDKPVPFLPARPERNPELGVRGVRLAMRHPDLLDTQLRAVAAVADDGPVGVMAPMVATVEEAEWFAERVAKVVGDGRAEVGVMVETPSAVLLASELAARLDFLSIGTNDLTQYLLAADRRHAGLAALQDPFHPAVLRAVRMTCVGAALGRAWVGVCGEAASRPAWALLAVGLGVSELSMQGSSIAEVRAAVRSATSTACEKAAAAALKCADAASARAVAEDVVWR